MGFCSASSKCFILIINLFFWACAAVLIYAGVQYMSSGDGVLNDVHNKPAFVTFGAAGLLILCGIVGIAGAFSEKKVLLGIFTVVIVATLVLFVVVSVTLFTQVDTAKNDTDKFLLEQFNNYKNPNLPADSEVELSRVARAVAIEKDNSSTPAQTTATTTTTTPATKPPTSATTTAAVKNTTTPKSTNKTTGTTTTTPATKPSTNGTTTAAAKNTTTPKPTNTPTTTPAATTTPATPDVNSTKFIDTLQTSLECCGYDNYTDWSNYKYWDYKKAVPNSCCNETAAAAKNTTCEKFYPLPMKNKDYIYQKGCKKELNHVVTTAYRILSWCAVGFCIFVFICFCSTMFLMCRKKDDGFNYSSIVA